MKDKAILIVEINLKKNNFKCHKYRNKQRQIYITENHNYFQKLKKIMSRISGG